jgi:hypothetical protein
VNPYVISFECTRGRRSEFDKTEAGTATVKLQDRLGDFDPTNAGGAFYPNIVPLRPFKLNVKHPFSGVFYDVFSGYTEDYVYEREGPLGAITTVPLTDGFELLEQATAPGGDNGCLYVAQHVDDRIRAALADANWPVGRRARIATGNVNVQSCVYDHGTSILEIIQDAADAEFPGVANFFMDKNGNAAFSGRGIRQTASPETTYSRWVKRWRVGDSGACALDPTLLPIFDLKAIMPKDQIYNDVVAAPRNVEQKHINANYVRNATSRLKYGRRKLSFLDLMTLYGTTTDQNARAETKDFATYYATNYAAPRSRISEIEFHAHMDEVDPLTRAALWDFVLQVELNHIIEVHTVHPGGGGFDGVDFYVEGINHDAANLNEKMPAWVMKLDLSPRGIAHYP